jgi:hypothetical protein
MEAWDIWLCDGEYHAIPLDVKRVPVEAGVTHIPSEPLQEYTYDEEVTETRIRKFR